MGESGTEIKFNGDFSIIDKALDQLINHESKGFSISNIISSVFCEHYGIDDIDDFNGWQCDWWAKFEYKNVSIGVSGCAWYGTIGVGLSEEEED